MGVSGSSTSYSLHLATQLATVPCSQGCSIFGHSHEEALSATLVDLGWLSSPFSPHRSLYCRKKRTILFPPLLIHSIWNYFILVLIIPHDVFLYWFWGLQSITLGVTLCPAFSERTCAAKVLQFEETLGVQNVISQKCVFKEKKKEKKAETQSKFKKVHTPTLLKECKRQTGTGRGMG